jgi:hypothetical protein
MVYKYIKDCTVAKKADNDTFVITEGNRAQTALYSVRCSVHCDCGLCVDLLWLVSCGCIKDSTTVEKTDIETVVITEGNRAQTALYTVRCSVHCDCGLCVDLLWLVTCGCIQTALLGKGRYWDSCNYIIEQGTCCNLWCILKVSGLIFDHPSPTSPLPRLTKTWYPFRSVSEAHSVQYTIQRKLNTAYSIILLQ